MVYELRVDYKMETRMSLPLDVGLLEKIKGCGCSRHLEEYQRFSFADNCLSRYIMR